MSGRAAGSLRRPSRAALRRARVGLAVVGSRLAAAASRTLGRGGTALPGLVAERIAPDLLSHLASQLPRGSIVVTGTNGKTTTSHMLARILSAAGLQPLRNASGSNLARGVATSLAAHAGPLGRLRATPSTIGLFETDEAAFAQVVPAVRPRVVAVTNLFRDQLDRYGEVDTVAAVWRTALERLGAQPHTLVLNADDPTVAALGNAFGSTPSGTESLYFGVDDPAIGRPGVEHASDAKTCPACGARLEYALAYYGHLGHYACANGHRRPSPGVAATRVTARGFEGTDLTIATPHGELTLTLPLPGLYNVYNALAAATSALAAGAPLSAIKEGLERFTAAFGRLERVAVGDKTAFLVLAKNPVGMNEALRTLFADGRPKHLLMALNDLDADGRDVSWIWDADFEHAAGHVATLVVSGRRAEDLALRLKYAGAIAKHPHLEPDLSRALDAALHDTPAGATLYCVLTYTAMLTLRKVLSDRGHVAPYWDL
ncbi:MAG TPA: MurT ligase domain-containing protein [Chloroflexota bacterium]|nr:MurT ligase domain-containing protein [Chloroflexota bacterium]